jgi:RNA recognition motif-containing protein
MYQDKRLDPEAKAALLEINGLPEHFDDNKLYDVFRPFGPLNLCKCVMKDGAFRGTAFIQFFNSYSSNEAVAQLVCMHWFFLLPFNLTPFIIRMATHWMDISCKCVYSLGDVKKKGSNYILFATVFSSVLKALFKENLY